MKKLLGFIFFLSFLSARSQSDSLKLDDLENLTPEELLQYYINEPEPIPFSKGPEGVGDSVYTVLNTLVIPTETVNIDSVRKQTAVQLDEDSYYDTPEYQFKPKIALGMGRMGYHGDLYTKHYQSPLTARPAFDLAISQRLTRYLQLNFNVLFGKVGANEWLNNRQENFQSEIRAGGLNLLYDFGNFIPDQYRVRPFVSFGITGFEFLSKTDLKDRNGNTYYYWSDGSIRNIAQNAPNAQNAVYLTRDYKYETDIRQLNKDGFGKYAERAWAFPLGFGFITKVTDRIDVKFNFQYFFTTTDYIDGITKNSLGTRAGTKQRDNFTYTSVSVQYDLITKHRPRIPSDTSYRGGDYFAYFADDDKDGVLDLVDDCLGTEAGAPVNAKGCPLDDDQDGIPNYRDDELDTPLGMPVNERGVGQGDQYWADWYAQYLNDSIDPNIPTEVIANFYDIQRNLKRKEEAKPQDIYTAELMRYEGSIPAEEMPFLLSIGDVNSKVLDDGSTVVYATGSYEKVSTAIKRRDEFSQEGNTSVGISNVKDKGIVMVGDKELDYLLQADIEDLLNMSIGGSSAPRNNNSSNEQTEGGQSSSEQQAGREQGYIGVDDVVYRVQLGAFKNKISSAVFKANLGVVELSSGEQMYRYVTRGFRTLAEAAAMRADLVVDGYGDAFITAYKGGKRISLREAGATTSNDYKEDMNETKMFSSIDKSLVVFKVQLGPNKKPGTQVNEMDELVKDLPGVTKQVTPTGAMRYSIGNFKTWEEAENYRHEMQDKGFTAAFVIATFKNEIISKLEAIELTK